MILVCHWDEFGLEIPKPNHLEFISISGSGGKNSTITFLVFLPNHKQPCLCVKMARFPRVNSLIRQEYKNLGVLHSCAKDFANGRAPLPLLESEISGLALFVQSVIAGPSMEARIWRARSLRRSVPVRQYLEEMRQLLNLFQEKTKTNVSTDELLEHVIMKPLERLLFFDILRDEHVCFFRDMNERLRSQIGATCPATVCHGDLRTKNIISLEHRQWGLIDWEFLQENTLPWFDWTELILSIARDTFGKPGQFHDPLVVRQLLSLDNPFTQLVSRETRMFCKTLKIDPAFVVSCLPIYFLMLTERIEEYQGAEMARNAVSLLNLSIEMTTTERLGLGDLTER